MKCYMHPTIDATHTCAECGKGICESCEIEVNGKIYCRPCTEKLATKQSTVGQTTVLSDQMAPQSPPPLSSQLGAQAPARKEPLIALALSFFIPGLGQAYEGLIVRGIAIFLAFGFIGFVSFVVMGMENSSSSGSLACCACIFWLALIAIWIWGMYDAYNSATRINKGEKVADKII